MSDAAVQIAGRLTELWRRSRPTILERMALLHAACETLTHDPGDVAARDAGREAAHKLSGVLGVFGLPRGSEIASSIEEMFLAPLPADPEHLATLRSRIADLDAVIASRPAD
jgi:HPt (histidine-containing phosphotransfer) domain-containing protein